MTDTLNGIDKTALYRRLESDHDLLNAALKMRKIAGTLAATISTSVPCFTDHSLSHMDALWVVTEAVLTQEEINQLSEAEVFLLVSSFYLHDLGMAYAATEDGRNHCVASQHYSAFLAHFDEHQRQSDDIKAQALAFTVRKIHAPAAHELSTLPIPGTDYYLFEEKAFREAWGPTCGQIAASHHWNIDRVDSELGKIGITPLPGNRSGDLGYVASILRIVDYAHINRERAPSMERAFKRPLPAESLMHWLAQENIDGPVRDGHELMYRSALPISNVDSWWLYYEMLSGLDSEIRTVQRYLKRRTSSANRFSLQGVLGAGSPEEASLYIKPENFMPIEVNLKTGSIDRLVKLLASESLYGNDPMAAVRELLQNANDAVRLKFHTAKDEFDQHVATLPIKIEFYEKDEGHYLEVSDFGVGMTGRVMTEYLISIASNYWETQFHHDFPEATSRGFSHAGKFGIGFLSVFMLGEEIEVTSNREGDGKTILKLHGVGRRGELRSASGGSRSGTTIKVKLKPSVSQRLSSVNQLIKAFAPMLETPIKTVINGVEETLPPNWLFELPPAAFKKQILGISSELNRRWSPQQREGQTPFDSLFEEPPEYSERRARLVVSSLGTSILCLKGLSLQTISTPGFVGIIELDNISPDVSRRNALNYDVSEILESARNNVSSSIIIRLEEWTSSGLVLNKFELIGRALATYGDIILRKSEIPWISKLSMPGDITVCNTKKLYEALQEHDTIFVAYDAHPWEAMRLWTNKHSTNGEAAFTMGNVGQGPGYTREIDYRNGTISELWPSYRSNVFFALLIRLISEKWEMNIQDLINQTNWRHEGAALFGRLTRIRK